MKRFTDLYGESVIGPVGGTALSRHPTDGSGGPAAAGSGAAGRPLPPVRSYGAGRAVESGAYGPQSGPLRHCGRTLRRSRRVAGR